ncbi:winged helix DNA-binding domain-containing protein [Agromyces aerolatus]|uniref:winged helix DNA-binding domain-containing protein n=1 Tax=Agromyces sp. LY-1074 TaxID=3074080 RepID=UPI00285F3E66|nr:MULTISPECIES: winged helix DNA-binding domain-containing protein [unclassified Agromyces]MDR5699598.1 winged helix DNA-binding domain-containing protein [Agromyces sp. LY-1074]MDR5705894.1 winged helix DNA-binding domain-containing protein [Agromyces sp. LY-1358]
MTTDRDVSRWRLRSQLLAAPHGDAEQVVRALLAVQAENPSQSAWAVATRTEAPDQDDLAAALATGQVLRTHILRSTWHYVPADDVHWLQELTSPRVLPVYEQQLRPLGDRVPAIAGIVEAALGEASALTRTELATRLAERGEPLTGQPLGLLMAWLEVHNRVTSGAPRDGEHTYALFDERVPAPRRLDRDEGLAELALRYFTSHGPATERDLMYWATLVVTDVRRGIAGAGDRLSSFEHDGRTFWHAAGEEPPASGESPTAPAGHLLQVLDEMYRGYQDSRWMLDSDGLVPRGREAAIGMALVDGQLLAAMKRTIGAKRVTFALQPYRALRARERSAIEEAAARYAAFLGLEPRVELAEG